MIYESVEKPILEICLLGRLLVIDLPSKTLCRKFVYLADGSWSIYREKGLVQKSPL